MPTPATYLGRDNRFAARVRLDSGEEARVYLPNTSRLIGVLGEGRAVLLEPAPPGRKTAWTMTRIRVDGVWVALDATPANGVMAAWMAAGNPLPGLGPVASQRAEVKLGRHRFDFLLELADGRELWLEVKSLGRASGGEARLSLTPSKRAGAHLAHLGELARAGTATALAFVLQRADARRLVIDDDADPGWVAALQKAREDGVHVLAFRCEVGPTTVEIVEDVPVIWS